MDRLVIASKNRGKVEEIRTMLAEVPLRILSLADYPDAPSVVEDGDSFLANALKKARILTEYTGMPSLADDSGLEVDFLQGAPGIYSSRYAGEEATDEENNRKLLAELNGVPAGRRGAAFRCVLVLYRPDGSYEQFTGRWPGVIGEDMRGHHGFGYDPLFYLPDLGKTAAEMTAEEKNLASHRSQAVQALKKYLQGILLQGR
ncbi:MAG TPA: XTP/dITP diphosphatase [Syntrophales bacterium]|nr:XTP/dITP diphosphatase [Syntrophales bacterium]HON22602.1 XTP/dITP diphosphatase [Syntrophales bacterium]HOU77096.1 XTP/dITP diphosphatase [Syntrophales bacterium]HPC32776.1 XTP/dITP diphosphatase [Syntrophales bacterium]HQG33624.1 XTP/dITP diphosphatase [Syntrophales bacterium]